MRGKKWAESEAKISLKWGTWVFEFVFPILWLLLQKKPLLLFFVKTVLVKKNNEKCFFKVFCLCYRKNIICTMIANQSSTFYIVFLIIFCFLKIKIFIRFASLSRAVKTYRMMRKNYLSTTAILFFVDLLCTKSFGRSEYTLKHSLYHLLRRFCCHY